MNTPELPKQEELATLRVLEEIEQNPDLTQRELSRRVGVSIGLTNLLLKKMVNQAWIKITSIPGRRLLYALTPKGFSEKIRKTKDFVRLSFRFYMNMRKSIVTQIQESGLSRPPVASYGAAELSEVVVEAVRDVEGNYLGEWEKFKGTERPEILVVLQKPSKGLRSDWKKKSIKIIDLS